MDVYGDHALCCKKSSDTITRHNRVRNMIAHFADVGLLSPELEKMGILGPTDRSRRRPGDVSFKSSAPNRGLAIDVAVICPLAASHLLEDMVLCVFTHCDNIAQIDSLPRLSF